MVKRLSVVCATAVLALACNKPLPPTAPSAGPTAAPGAAPAALPATLENLYPPKAKAPVYLMKMIELAHAFEAVMVDLFEKDQANLKADLDRFKAAYVATSKLVPEWQHKFTQEPLQAFEAALGSGDQQKVMGAVGQLSGVCESCHVANMAPVQFRFHWRDIAAIKVTDPITKQELPFKQFKHMLSAALTGISVNLRQGQQEAAEKSYQAFKARFGALAGTCSECHDTDRRYYVDDDMQKIVDELGQAMANPDPKTMMQLGQRIGRDSCFKCHLVHVPAAMSKARARPVHGGH